MTIIPAVITNEALARWPKMHGGKIAHATFSYFKVGEGGWYYNGVTLQRERRTPDATLTDLDIVLDTARTAPEKRYDVSETMGYYTKALSPSDLIFDSPSTLRINCILDTTEYNAEDDGTLVYDLGGPYTNPEVWEIGVFDTDDVMVLYGTFPKETKDSSRQLGNVVRLVYAQY